MLTLMKNARRGSSAAVGAFTGGYAISALGTGAVYPVNVIYLHLIRGLAVPMVGLAITVSAAAALASSPGGGYAVERFGPRAVTIVALFTQAAGAIAMVVATSASRALAAMALQGTGNGLFYAALTPLIVRMTDEDRRIRLFSLRYAVNNAGIGLGALAGGLVISRYGLSGYITAYLANALSCILFAIAVSWCPAGGDTPAGGRGVTPRDYLTSLTSRRFRRLLIMQFLVVSFGYAQIDSSLPLYVKQHLGMPAILIGGLIVTNTAIIVMFQLPAGRWVAARGSGLSLRLLGAIWALAMLIGFTASLLPRTAALVTVFLSIAVFSAGECLYAPAFQSALVQSVGLQQLGRHAALASMTWTMALIGGPALGIALVQFSWPPAYWLVLSTAAVAIAMLSRRASDGKHPARRRYLWPGRRVEARIGELGTLRGDV